MAYRYFGDVSGIRSIKVQRSIRTESFLSVLIRVCGSLNGSYLSNSGLATRITRPWTLISRSQTFIANLFRNNRVHQSVLVAYVCQLVSIDTPFLRLIG